MNLLYLFTLLISIMSSLGQFLEWHAWQWINRRWSVSRFIYAFDALHGKIFDKKHICLGITRILLTNSRNISYLAKVAYCAKYPDARPFINKEKMLVNIETDVSEFLSYSHCFHLVRETFLTH